MTKDSIIKKIIRSTVVESNFHFQNGIPCTFPPNVSLRGITL